MRAPHPFRCAVLLIAVLQSVASFAAMSQTFTDWGKGPASWLMTRDEEKKWKSIDNDADAQAFIDLFWARRDPTPGTFENEARAEFEARVKYADEEFKDRDHRGSMSDRGRALIVLGWPSNMDKNLAYQRTSASVSSPSTGGATPTGDHSRGIRLGAKDVWIYEGADAQKYGLPRIEIVFLEDPVSGVVQRDPQRTNMMAALPVAIEKAVVSKDLKAAPPWSKQAPTQIAFVPLDKGGPVVPSNRKAIAGAHALMLVKDAMAFPSPQGSTDPFASAVSADTFSSSADLGYVFEYCGAAENLKTTIAIHGTGTSKVSMVAPADEFPVEAIKTVPGCGLVRASIPLGELNMAKGTYTFSVKVDDGQQSWDLGQDFKVE